MNQNSHCTQEILLEMRYFERGLSKSLNKNTLFFLLNPLTKIPLFFLLNSAPFNGQSYQKRGLELVPSALQVTKKVQKNSVIRYIFSGKV